MHEFIPEWVRYLLGLAAVALGVLGAAYARRAPGSPRPAWQRAAAAALVAAGVAYLGYLAWELVPALWERAARRDDMVRYYVIAGRAMRGQALYWPWPDYGPHFATPGYPYPQPRYPYPPFLMGVLVPFAGLPLLVFGRIWYVVLYAGLAVYAASLAKLATGRVTVAGVVVAAAVVAAVPGSQLAFQVANVEPVLWALFGAALAWPAARGFGFAASAMVKLYCAWPLLAAVPRDGWRVVRGAALALALGTVLCMAVLGPAVFLGSFVDWARYMLPVVGQGTWAVDPHYGGTNVSFSFAGLRLARELGWEYRPGPLPGWARLYLTVVGVAAPVLALWLTRRMRDTALRCGIVAIAAVLFAPLCWATYLPLLLAPLAAWVRLRHEHTSAEDSGVPPAGAGVGLRLRNAAHDAA